MQAQPHCWNEQNLITGAYDQQLSNNRLINEWQRDLSCRQGPQNVSAIGTTHITAIAATQHLTELRREKYWPTP